MHALPEDDPATIKFLGLIKSEIEESAIGDQRVAPTKWLFTSRNTHSIGQVLKPSSVSLVDLEDEKYGDKVQQELRIHANAKIIALQKEKEYNNAIAYFASSLIGDRAQNRQWIDIACVHLEEFSPKESELRVRQILEAMPQDLKILLEQAWLQIFRSSEQDVNEIKEMLRALVLTYEDPTEPELGILTGIDPSKYVAGEATNQPESPEKFKGEIHRLAQKCRPLLVIKRTTEKEVRITFMNAVVKEHLLENSEKLLGLSREAMERNHGMFALRAFEHLLEVLNFPEESEVDITPVGSEKDPNEEEEDVNDFFGGFSFSDSEQSDDDDDDDDSDSDESSTDYDTDSDLDEDDSQFGMSPGDDSTTRKKDPEAEKVANLVLPYMVKHWLHHASKAHRTMISSLLSSEEKFWKQGSMIRRRWLVRYAELTGAFDALENLDSDLSALHVASAIGFR